MSPHDCYYYWKKGAWRIAPLSEFQECRHDVALVLGNQSCGPPKEPPEAELNMITPPTFQNARRGPRHPPGDGPIVCLGKGTAARGLVPDANGLLYPGDEYDAPVRIVITGEDTEARGFGTYWRRADIIFLDETETVFNGWVRVS